MPYLCSTRTRQASQRCSNERVVFFIAMTTKITYSKSYTEESSLIALLQSRGLSITDESKAQHYLTHIGYYRLSAYMYPLLCTPKEQHIYKKGTTLKWTPKVGHNTYCSYAKKNIRRKVRSYDFYSSFVRNPSIVPFSDEKLMPRAITLRLSAA